MNLNWRKDDSVPYCGCGCGVPHTAHIFHTRPCRSASLFPDSGCRSPTTVYEETGSGQEPTLLAGERQARDAAAVGLERHRGASSEHDGIHENGTRGFASRA